MYVRTKKGEIFDCYESEQMHKPIYYPKKSKTNGYIDYEDVYKKSDNLIDILQIGDYVNGNPVCLIKEDEHNRKWIYTDSNYKCGYLEEDIEKILTHEQFEKMMYKIGDINE